MRRAWLIMLMATVGAGLWGQEAHASIIRGFFFDEAGAELDQHGYCELVNVKKPEDRESAPVLHGFVGFKNVGTPVTYQLTFSDEHGLTISCPVFHLRDGHQLFVKFIITDKSKTKDKRRTGRCELRDEPL